MIPLSSTVLVKKESAATADICSYTDSRGHILLGNIFYSGLMCKKSICMQGEWLQSGRFQNAFLHF